MRERNEVEADIADYYEGGFCVSTNERLTVEVLLDIRDLLVEIKKQGEGQEITVIEKLKDSAYIESLNKQRENLGLSKL